MKNIFYDRLIHFMAGIGIAGIFFLCSCDPIKRHQKLVEKYPYVHTQDTVVFRDTIRLIVPKVQVDTIVSYRDLKDTIVIEKDRLKIKMYAVRDSIFVTGSCDTVFVEKEVIRKVPVVHTAVKNGWETFGRTFAWVLGMIVLILIMAYLILRKNEK